MANDTPSKVLELVIFTLQEGASRGKLLDTETSMDAWLPQQPGLQSYDLLLGADGDTWVFIGWWRTLAEA
jgi:hypothetical protein